MLDYGANEGGGGCNSIMCFPTSPSNLPSHDRGNGGSGGNYCETHPSACQSTMDDVQCPANHPNCGLGQSCGQGGMYDCPSTPNTPNLPAIQVLHPIDTQNAMIEIPIYDFSYHPPRLIGNRRTSYAIDYINVDPSHFLPIPSDPITTTSLIVDVGEIALKPGLTNLASVGIVISCTGCGIVLDVGFFLYDVNNAVTFDVHVRTHDVYFHESPFELPVNQFP